MSESFVGIAKAIKNQPEAVFERPSIEADHTAELDRIRLNQLKPELFALAALASDEVIDKAIGIIPTFPPYGLIDVSGNSVQKLDSLFALQTNLNSSLDRALGRTISDHHAHQPPYMTRFISLCDLFHENVWEGRYSSPTVLIRSGIGTATGVTHSGLAAIARMVQNANPSATSQEIASVARNSLPMIIKVASVNVDYLRPVEGLLEVAGEFPDPRYTKDVQSLELKTKEDGSICVDFIQPILQSQDPYTNGSITIGHRHTKLDTLGCPATARLNGSSAISKLWHWAVDIAEAEDLLISKDVYQLTPRADFDPL